MALEAIQPQEWPKEAIRLDNMGSYVIKEELTEDKQFFKITTKDKHAGDGNLSFEDQPIYDYYESAYDKGYVGRQEEIDFITKQGLILVQKALPTHKVCSIGYQPETAKWWGWSHRARYGFAIGDVVKEGDLTATSGYIEEYEIQHPEENKSLPVGFKALTTYDAKRMAIAFALSVS